MVYIVAVLIFLKFSLYYRLWGQVTFIRNCYVFNFELGFLKILVDFFLRFSSNFWHLLPWLSKRDPLKKLKKILSLDLGPWLFILDCVLVSIKLPHISRASKKVTLWKKIYPVFYTISVRRVTCFQSIFV